MCMTSTSTSQKERPAGEVLSTHLFVPEMLLMFKEKKNKKTREKKMTLKTNFCYCFITMCVRMHDVCVRER